MLATTAAAMCDSYEMLLALLRRYEPEARLGTLIARLSIFTVPFLVVWLAILGICVWANSIGALVPLLARRFGVDPALISAPLISTLVDTTGLVIFYSIAILLLIKLA